MSEITNKTLESNEPSIIKQNISEPDFPNLTLAVAKELRLEPKEVNDRFQLTVGFTVDRLGELLQQIDPSGSGGLNKTLGWNFVLPPEGAATGDGLISGITVNRVFAEVSQAETEIKVIPLSYPNGGTAVSLTPKVFYQRKSIGPNTPPMTYGNAFDLTLPRCIEIPDLKVKDFEGFKNWTDLAFFSRGALEQSQSYLSGSVTGFNDMFFSGCTINYATPHNPLLRVEQLTIANRHDGNLLGAEASLPFTLKAEYYISSEHTGQAWLGLAGDETSTAPPFYPGEVKVPSGTARNRSLDPASTTEQAFLPGALILPPCPPFWRYPETLGASFRLAYPLSSFQDQAAISAAVFSALNQAYTGGQSSIAVNIDSVNTDSVNPPPQSLTFAQKLKNLFDAIAAFF